MELIRLATPDDAESILEIYRPAIVGSPISFEIEVPSLDEMRRRISETLRTFPWLAFEGGGEVLGYACAGSFKTRAAYAWSVESSVYVRNDSHGKGIGKKLYLDLIQRLKAQGILNVIGGVTLPNEASVRLHETLGFEKVAHFKSVGFKLGSWWDVGYWQLELNKPLQPEPVRKLGVT